MNNELLPRVELSSAHADKAIIWLHGLGANGHDFEPMVPELNLPPSLNIRFVFPHAPQRPVTINNGMVMSAWYDIASPQFEFNQDEAGIRQSQQLLHNLIGHEVERGIAYENIVLAGFSQGGVIALHTGLRYPHRLAGVLALSTYLPLAHTFENEAAPVNKQLPIMIAHGTHDPVVPFHLAEDSRLFLEDLGYQIEWRQYPMEHSVHPAEIHDIATWLQKVLGNL